MDRSIIRHPQPNNVTIELPQSFGGGNQYLKYSPDWKPLTEYQLNHLVKFKGKAYINLKPSCKGVRPDSDDQIWQELVHVPEPCDCHLKINELEGELAQVLATVASLEEQKNSIQEAKTELMAQMKQSDDKLVELVKAEIELFKNLSNQTIHDLMDQVPDLIQSNVKAIKADIDLMSKSLYEGIVRPECKVEIKCDVKEASRILFPVTVAYGGAVVTKGRGKARAKNFEESVITVNGQIVIFRDGVISTDTSVLDEILHTEINIDGNQCELTFSSLDDKVVTLVVGRPHLIS